MKDPCFAKARYLLTKLCNIFDEAFLFDVSIVSIDRNRKEVIEVF